MSVQVLAQGWGRQVALQGLFTLSPVCCKGLPAIASCMASLAPCLLPQGMHAVRGACFLPGPPPPKVRHWPHNRPSHIPSHTPAPDTILHAASSISRRRYLVWRADVGRLPGAGQRLMSSGALTISTRRLYLCMERAGASGEEAGEAGQGVCGL